MQSPRNIVAFTFFLPGNIKYPADVSAHARVNRCH